LRITDFISGDGRQAGRRGERHPCSDDSGLPAPAIRFARPIRRYDGRIPAESRKASLLQITIASCEAMVQELEANANPADLEFVFELERVVHRASNELAKLNEHRSE
jgi:hypothetical protein